MAASASVAISVQGPGPELLQHVVLAEVRPPTNDDLVRTKVYIDKRARDEWRQQYGEVHEEYVTVQSQVSVDDVSGLPAIWEKEI
jgi:hypothetical protein